MSRVAHAVFDGGLVRVSPRPGPWTCALRVQLPEGEAVSFHKSRALARQRRVAVKDGRRLRWQVVATRPGWPPSTLATRLQKSLARRAASAHDARLSALVPTQQEV